MLNEKDFINNLMQISGSRSEIDIRIKNDARRRLLQEISGVTLDCTITCFLELQAQTIKSGLMNAFPTWTINVTKIQQLNHQLDDLKTSPKTSNPKTGFPFVVLIIAPVVVVILLVLCVYFVYIKSYVRRDVSDFGNTNVEYSHLRVDPRYPHTAHICEICDGDIHDN